MSMSRTTLANLGGKVVLVTGASSGIGEAAAVRLASAGARVLVHGRSPARTAAVAARVGTDPFVADFSRLDDVRNLAQRVKEVTNRLDVVIHNAGALIPERIVTENGHELTFQGNHLAGFLLQALLKDLVIGAAGARIIVTSSSANLRGHIDLEDLDRNLSPYHAFAAYAATKLENILFVRELSRRLAGTGVVSVAVHPGAVATRYGTGTVFPGAFMQLPVSRVALVSAETGAEPLVRLAAMLDLRQADGLYYRRFRPRGRTSRQADDPALARGLWERSEEMVKAWMT
jgi:NAD(P)-dependent dehydrogenase (short-subunit alcohol dehydrogenase family)